jgi:hypothetical protein
MATQEPLEHQVSLQKEKSHVEEMELNFHVIQFQS